MVDGTWWRARPVFITSTFRDMHAERDYLRAYVIPELEERLRARRVFLEPVDLRWGVDTMSAAARHAKELQVLQVCLAEVERSRPFLVGLLGDRYGSVLPAESLRAAAQEAGLEGPVAGKSLTELEIDFGAFARGAERPRCLFYFRDPLPYDRMDPATAAQYADRHDPAPGATEAAERLTALKARLKAAFPDRVRSYRADCRFDPGRGTWVVAGLEAWGRTVLEDLWRELDADTAAWASQPPPSWQDEERGTLELFLADRARNFTGREGILGELLARARAPERTGQAWGTCVTGPPGAGKSALLAELALRLRGDDVLVLTHAAGISVRAPQVDAMLRRWARELAVALGEDDALADDALAEEVDGIFGALLARAGARRRVVVLVDALDQFEPTTRGRYVTWLPLLLPPNVRLIATAIPGTGSEALAQRDGVELVPLPSLSEREAGQLARGVCGRHHRAIGAGVLGALLEKRAADGAPAAGNPLWLELAVEELNLLDADDYARAERVFDGSPEQRLHQLLLSVVGELPSDVQELYGWTLERAERLHGRAWAKAFVSLIAVSRAGWREADLRRLMPTVSDEEWTDLAFAALRRTLRAHVVRRGAAAQWDFSHPQMRIAVGRRYLGARVRRRALHAVIAEYLEALPPDDPLHETETMAHLLGTDDRARAARYYGGPLSDGEAAGATRALVEELLAGIAAGADDRVEWIASLPDGEGLDADRRRQLCDHFLFPLDAALRREAPLGARLAIARSAQRTLRALVAQHPVDAQLQRALSVSHSKVGDLLRASGDLTGALEAYQADLTIAQRLAAQDPESGNRQRDVSVSHDRVGDVRRARGDLAGALASYEAALAIAGHLTDLDPTNTEWQRDHSVSFSKIGDVRRAQGDLHGALAAYRAWSAIAERLAERDPDNVEWQRGLSVSHGRIGDVLRTAGDLTGAMRAHRAALAIAERLTRQDPANVRLRHHLSVSHSKIGDVSRTQGAHAAALEAYRTAARLAERLVGQDPANTDWQRHLSVMQDRVGDVLQAQGDFPAAREAYETARAQRARLAAQDPTNAEAQRDLVVSQNRVADILRAQHDLAGALDAYRSALTIVQRLTAQHPANVIWQSDLSVSHDRIGDVLSDQGDLTGALQSYRAALDIAERVAAQHPANKDWQRERSVSENKIGDLLRARDDVAGASRAYHAALEIVERLVAEDAANAEWQRDLAVTLHKLAGVLAAQGDDAEAKTLWQRCSDVLRRMEETGMYLDPPLRDLFRELSGP